MNSRDFNRQKIKNNKKFDLPKLYNELGGIGKFQIYVMFLSCLACFMSGIAVVNIIFIGWPSDHR